MTRENKLRLLLQAIQRQVELGFNEKGDLLNLQATARLEREVRVRLAAEELHDPEYPEAVQ